MSGWVGGCADANTCTAVNTRLGLLAQVCPENEFGPDRWNPCNAMSKLLGTRTTCRKHSQSLTGFGLRFLSCHPEHLNPPPDLCPSGFRQALELDPAVIAKRGKLLPSGLKIGVDIRGANVRPAPRITAELAAHGGPGRTVAAWARLLPLRAPRPGEWWQGKNRMR